MWGCHEVRSFNVYSNNNIPRFMICLRNKKGLKKKLTHLQQQQEPGFCGVFSRSHRWDVGCRAGRLPYPRPAGSREAAKGWPVGRARRPWHLARRPAAAAVDEGGPRGAGPRLRAATRAAPRWPRLGWPRQHRLSAGPQAPLRQLGWPGRRLRTRPW